MNRIKESISPAIEWTWKYFVFVFNLNDDPSEEGIIVTRDPIGESIGREDERYIDEE